ncbi:TonB-dependent receptor [Exilibacterium tricleocarpae]|uniref:TonB-dependent receptor n=1 Tax=Exilibacterium tricleocarpae TaxID=2591008 RepID=A0A545T292_9GAMM|nr:TonB-dependent receptor [Exilibacterium tricleocarpae]TQV71341.1 TonB-dependent receptor [Exilibacterium tricleocarpae]
MAKLLPFQQRLFLPLIAICSLGPPAPPAKAQRDEALAIEEVVVTGIRQAQETSIGIKRAARSIVDSISSEDIGKLPDITITDSLARITGVQVRRSAGEGGGISIRGLPQVLATLNGESYLGSGSVTTVQPDFNDIPSQLFSGADVIKSATAGTNAGGITGVVDLKTFRPFAFGAGFTLSGATEIQSGRESDETDPSVNGLVSWHNEKVGAMASVSYQEKNLANYYSGMTNGGENAGWSQIAGEDWAWGADINNDGDTNDAFLAYQGHLASNRFTERERLGYNVAFQFDLGEGFELVAELFHTEMEEYQRSAGLFHSDKWNRWGWFRPQNADGSSAFRDTGITIDGRDFFTTQTYTGNGRRIKSFSSLQFEDSSSQNINIELNYDKGGPLVASARAVVGEAQRTRLFSSADIDLAIGNQWGVAFQNYTDGLNQAVNPGGYAGFPTLTVDYGGDGAAWSGFDNNANLDAEGNAAGAARTIGDYLADIDSYGVGALISENNFDREAELNVVRFDGRYGFQNDGFITSVDAGVRFSARKVKNREFDIAAPFGENDCLVKWKATDVTLNQSSCNSGQNLNDGNPDNDIFFTSGRPLGLRDLGDVIRVTDVGPVRGIPGFFALDPAAMDNVWAFHNAFYPGNVRVSNPGKSYRVDLDELSYYLQVNFAYGQLAGNLGLRQLETTLTVVQNVVGDSQPYGLSAIDAGDLVTERELTDTLPALNLSYDLSDKLKLRAAYAKTVTPLDLAQWGGAFDPDFTLDGDAGSPTFGTFIAVSATETGNPNLDPWRADNVDLSLEYYLGDASLLNLGLFRVEVDSFTQGGEELRALPDADGVVRRSVPVSTITQGDGGTLEGVEMGAKLALVDFPGLAGSWLGHFGADVNYTYSPGDSGQKDVEGNELGFPENSEDVYNIVLWYETDKWQARIGYNYRSERVVLLNQAGSLTLMQEATAYLDASVSYHISDRISVFLNGSNLTDESERFYLQRSDQEAWENTLEPRYTMGVRGTF